MPTPQEQKPSVATEISNRMVRLLSEYTGRGPTKARAMINPDMIVVLFQDVLTRGERKLVDAGEMEPVTLLRRTFQRLMEDDAVRTIEELTGRRVGSVLSDIDPKANLGANLFILDHRPQSGDAITIESTVPLGDEQRNGG